MPHSTMVKKTVFCSSLLFKNLRLFTKISVNKALIGSPCSALENVLFFFCVAKVEVAGFEAILHALPLEQDASDVLMEIRCTQQPAADENVIRTATNFLWRKRWRSGCHGNRAAEPGNQLHTPGAPWFEPRANKIMTSFTARVCVHACCFCCVLSTPRSISPTRTRLRIHTWLIVELAIHSFVQSFNRYHAIIKQLQHSGEHRL